MIEVKNVDKSFGGNHVLKNISAKFEQGKNNLIIGRSGSGKTVLMKCLVGLLDIDGGEILYNGRDFTKMKFREKKEIRKEIGMLFQGGALFDFMSVEGNVMFPITMFTSQSINEKCKRVDFCLDRVNMQNTNNLMPSELSGGMKKRVAIARAMALNPAYLFCDEPNSGLDPQTSHVIDKLISEITREFNITTVINTHDMNSVLEIGDNIIFIYDGKMWWSGDKNQVLSADNKEISDFVFTSKLTRKLKQ